MLTALQQLGVGEECVFEAIEGCEHPNRAIPSGNWCCALSKSAVMSEAVQLKKPLFLLEDDIVVRNKVIVSYDNGKTAQIHDLFPFVEECLQQLPKDWKILYLGYYALDAYPTMKNYRSDCRVPIGKHVEKLANPNLNHAVFIRDIDCLAELSSLLKKPDSYDRKQGRYASDFVIAHYFANKDIPMYGITPNVILQYSGYSDTLKKEVNKQVNPTGGLL